MRVWLPLIAASFLTLPVDARELDVPVEKGWQHAASGVVLRQPLAGLVRNRLEDSTDGEFDVSANYRSPDGTFGVTIFIFSSPLDDAGIWFERAAAQITDSGRYGAVTPIAAPTSLILPGGSKASGFRQSFAASTTVKGTSVGVAQIGTWLVALRVSSVSADAAATDAELTTLISAIGWPTGSAPKEVALPATCSDSLTFGKAKVVRPDGADVLLSAIMPMVTAEAAAKGEAKLDERPLCRDSASTPTAGLYRRQGDRTGYTLVVGDAGRVITVAPNLMAALGGGKTKVAITLSDVDGSSSVFSSFSALPKPEQVLAVIGGNPISVTKGKDISLAPDAMK